MGTTSFYNHEEIPWVTTILIAMGAGLIGMMLYAWSEHSWVVLACSILIGVAAAVAGALIGFVFGIPKTSATATSTTETSTVTATSQYQGNSNLEQISDWLTKILVGAGLVQLGAIRQELNALGSRFGTSGSLGSSGWIVGPALIIAYSVCGFLLAYLWARIYMAQALVAGSGQGETAAAAKSTAAASADATATTATVS